MACSGTAFYTITIQVMTVDDKRQHMDAQNEIKESLSTKGSWSGPTESVESAFGKQSTYLK
jgi:hypothetical protein